MLPFFQHFSRKREIYFHEDDYCQQQLLPREATTHAAGEIQKIDAFSDAHRAPDGAGWTDIYLRNEAPIEFRTLKVKSARCAALVAPILPAFNVVLTGYSSHREQCKNTAAWGISDDCSIFADWSDDGVITNVWTEFSDGAEESIRLAARAVAVLSTLHPLVFVDWAWGYTCEASAEDQFTTMLRTKLETIDERAKEIKKGLTNGNADR